MMDDYELDYDFACKKCGCSPIHWRRCTEMYCDDGTIDLYEEDPQWFDPGDMERCQTCHGTGIERWCPKCDADLCLPKTRVEV